MKRQPNLMLRLALYSLGALGALYLIYEDAAQLAACLQEDTLHWHEIARHAVLLLVWLGLEWALLDKCKNLYKEKKAA